MEINKQLQDKTNEIQKELQNIVGQLVLSKATGIYQDHMNVAIFIKLAQLELRIEKIEAKPSLII